jgi:capsular exopolysaccharide synthesis family protein
MGLAAGPRPILPLVLLPLSIVRRSSNRMELRDYLRIVRKRALLIAVAALICGAAALVTSLATAPVYQSRTKLFVVTKTDPEGGTASAYEGALLSQQLVKSLAQIIESRATAEEALRLDPQPFTPRQLQSKIRAEPAAETLLIDLSVEDTDPVRAKRLANSVARAFIAAVPRLLSGSGLRVSLVEPALASTEPVRPRTSLNLALGLILGLSLGIGLAFLRQFLDRSVKTPEELELAIGAPVVGTIPPFKATKQPLPVAEQPRTSAAEAFRKLRTNFAFLGVDRQSLCCVVTSPTAADGKSTVAANLAVALAQAGQRVAIIDADLRKPTLHKLFRLQQRVGTTTVLLDRVGVHDAIQDQGPNLPSVLTSGQLPPNPSELLGSMKMQELISELRAMYEVVLIDCAPLLPVTDPMVVSRFSDGILLITRAGITTRDHVQASRAACNKAGAKVFGSVLNATPITEGDQPAYYTYYGESESQRADMYSNENQGLAAAGGVNAHSSVEPERASRHRRLRSGAR